MTAPTGHCGCRNHLGRAKQLHRSRLAALTWATRAAKHGMRLEPYRCPTTRGWHIRTARDKDIAA